MSGSTTTSVPTFIIKINGSRIPPEKDADVKEIVVTERIDAPSQFSIVVSDLHMAWADSSDMTEGTEVSITMGYKDDVDEIFKGEITGLTPCFKKNQTDTLTIKGYSKLHRLVRAKKTNSFTEMSDSDIVEQIANDAGLSPDIENVGSERLFTMQSNQTDYEYIMEMARKFNYKVWIEDGNLCFKSQIQGSGDSVVLEWGKTLIEFQPELNTIGLVSEVEVRGWDDENVQAITGTATSDSITDLVGGQDSGAKIVNDNFGAAKMAILDTNIIDQNSADQAALDYLTKNSMNYIRATGRCQGNKSIRAGMTIQINDVGGKFSGEYFVYSARHVLSMSQGYSTYFELARNAV